jgi:menaquinone-9 beta-reductase
MSASYDAIIIGARCAGAATALLLARRGLRVLVVDRDEPGRDTLSTHALMRPAVIQLARWGLLDRVIAAGTPAIRTTTFHYGERRVPVEIRPRSGVDALYAPRRTLLDPLLAGAAAEAGAEVLWGTRVVGLLRDVRGRVSGVALRPRDGGTMIVRQARVVIGADGLGSTIARLVGAAVMRQAARWTTMLYAHWAGAPSDGYHWYYRPGVSAGVIPTDAGQACVFVAAPPERVRAELRRDPRALYRSLLGEAAPEVAAALPADTPLAVHPFAGRPGVIRQAWGPGWALVGDAGYFRDPLTAHGMSDALRDAELLADAVVRGTPAAYAEFVHVRDELSRELFDATEAIAAFSWDLDGLGLLHRRLSAAMNREGDYLSARDDLSRGRFAAS